MTPEELVDEVFARVRAGDWTVMDLYVENPRLEMPGGTVVEGREALRQHYQRVLDEVKPQPQVLGLYANPPMVVALVRTAPSGPPNHADVFTVEDGKVKGYRACLPVPRGD